MFKNHEMRQNNLRCGARTCPDRPRRRLRRPQGHDAGGHGCHCAGEASLKLAARGRVWPIFITDSIISALISDYRIYNTWILVYAWVHACTLYLLIDTRTMYCREYEPQILKIKSNYINSRIL